MSTPTKSDSTDHNSDNTEDTTAMAGATDAADKASDDKATVEAQALRDITGWNSRPRQPFLTKGNLFLWYFALVVVLGFTAYGIWMRLTQGLTVTDLTSQVPWGTWVVFYVYFVGLSAGATMFSSLIYAFRIKFLEDLGKPSLAVGIISLGVGLAFIGMDLGSLLKSPNAILFFHWTSPLSWAVRAYLVYLALLVVQLFIAVRVQRGHFRNLAAIAWWQRLLSAVTLPLAIIGVLGAEGSLFAVVKVRGMWAGGLFPVIFLASAIVAATALLSFLHYAQRVGSGQQADPKIMNFMAQVMLAALLIDAGLTAYEYGIPLLSQNHHELEIIRIVMAGPFAWTFWVLQVALGLLIPIVLLLNKWVRHNAFMVAGIGLMILVGLVGVRFNIVLPPQIAPIIQGYPLNDYFPSMTELTSSMFLAAAGLTAYTILSQWQPIHDRSTDVYEWLAAAPHGSNATQPSNAANASQSSHETGSTVASQETVDAGKER